MACIIKAKHASCFAQLVICQAFEGRLCRNGHEDGQWDIAVGYFESASARFGCLWRESHYESGIGMLVEILEGRTEHLA